MIWQRGEKGKSWGELSQLGWFDQFARPILVVELVKVISWTGGAKKSSTIRSIARFAKKLKEADMLKMCLA